MKTEAEPGHLPTAGAPLPAPRVALAVVTAVFLSISLLGFVHVLFLDMGPGEVTLSFGCIVILLLMQLQWYGRAAARLRSPFGAGVLAAQSLLVYLPILIFGQAWVGMPGFLAGSVLLVLRPVAAWVSFCAIVVSMAAAQLLFTGSLVDIIYRSISTVTTGLTVYGLSRLTALVIEVQSTRAEMARMAVLRERLRFAHDLHDMLDCSLSAITMKIEATQRLIEKCRKEASDQLLETLEISRLALSDARTIAAGYRQVSLEDECRSAVSLLQAADRCSAGQSDHRPAHAREHRAGGRTAHVCDAPAAPQQDKALRHHHSANARPGHSRDRQRRHATPLGGVGGLQSHPARLVSSGR